MICWHALIRAGPRQGKAKQLSKSRSNFYQATCEPFPGAQYDRLLTNALKTQRVIKLASSTSTMRAIIGMKSNAGIQRD